MVTINNAAEFGLIFTYLSDTEKDLNKMYDLSKETLKKIDDAEPNSENSYEGELKKVANKYKEDVYDEIDKIKYYTKIFNENLSIVNKNKDKNEYPQNKQKFYDYWKKYKDLSAKYEKFTEDISKTLNDDEISHNFRKYSAYMKVFLKVRDLFKICEYIRDKIDDNESLTWKEK